jgi:hypothetical protein
MTTMRLALRLLLLVAFTATSFDAMAVCLDENLVSGYHVRLAKEIKTAYAIVVGTVQGKKVLQEDSSNRDGITATIYTVRITRVLRGKVPGLIEIRSENDSGRFWMELEKQYLLFLSRDQRNHGYFVNSCGNSGLLAENGETLHLLDQAAK